MLISGGCFDHTREYGLDYQLYFSIIIVAIIIANSAYEYKNILSLSLF